VTGGSVQQPGKNKARADISGRSTKNTEQNPFDKAIMLG
jgi:hypothetical protein